MASIWDGPGVAPAEAPVTTTPSVAPTDAGQWLNGAMSPLDRQLNVQYRLWPDAYNRLSAATRTALGR